MNIQEVIEVEKTVSPNTLLGAPNERPWKVWPVLRCNAAGRAEGGGFVTVARPRAKRGRRRRRVVNMLIGWLGYVV